MSRADVLALRPIAQQPVRDLSRLGLTPRWNKFLNEVARALRRGRRIATAADRGWFIERTIFNERPYMLPLAWFVTRGCSMDHAGSCTMCNFGAGDVRTDDELVAQVDDLVERMGPIPMIYITPLGSMFDDAEVSSTARSRIFERIAATGCQVYGTESRPESITEEKMWAFRRAFGTGVELQIGLGLESSDAYVRRNCTNKGLTEADYLRAIDVMRAYGVKAMVHVLLKPAFLTEREAIEDAVATCEWAWRHGADRIIFLMTNLKPNTLVNWLAERGRYRVPYLWSGVEVLRRTGAGPQRPMTLSGVYAGTPIHERARNCASCSDAYLEEIQHFSMTLDTRILAHLAAYDCPCRGEWSDEVRAARAPLASRLPSQYAQVGRDLFGEEWWSMNRSRVLDELEVTPE